MKEIIQVRNWVSGKNINLPLGKINKLNAETLALIFEKQGYFISQTIYAILTAPAFAREYVLKTDKLLLIF